MKSNNGDHWLPIAKKQIEPPGKPPTKKYVGQKAKLKNKVKRKKIIELISRGLCVRHSCAAVGISSTAFYDFRKTNKNFSLALEAAIAKGVEARLAIIEKAQSKDWRSAAWYLERVHPSLYGRNKLELTGEGGGPINIEASRSMSDIKFTEIDYQDGKGLLIDLPDYNLPENDSQHR